MVGRASLIRVAVLAGALSLAFAPAALAQQTPGFTFGHNDALDGTPAEIQSGFYPGDDGNDANGDALADREPNSFETFEFEVPEGHVNGSFTVTITWQDPRIDLDVYVYRLRDDGSIVSTNVASGASFGTNSETALYYPNTNVPVEPDRYLIVVDNWCSRDLDDAGTANCGIGEDLPDEDDFVGSLTFGPGRPDNPPPSVRLSGPDGGRVGQALAFSAAASDNGRIARYQWDLDGDGRFEVDTDTSNTVSTRYETAGTYNVGVQVTDDQGGRGYDSKAVTIRRAGAVTPASLSPLSQFRLGRPVFGGTRNRSLEIRYRLRVRARVVLSLYRGNRRVRRLKAGTDRARRLYRVKVRPRGLRRGTYNVRIRVRTRAGVTERRRVYSKRL